MNQRSKDDEALSSALRRADGEIALDEATEALLLARMLDRFASDQAGTSAQAESEADGVVVVELDLVPRSRSSEFRTSTWLGRAAAVILLVGGTAALVAVIRGGDTDAELPAISDTASVPESSLPATPGPAPSTDFTTPDLSAAAERNKLGYRELTSFDFEARDEQSNSLANINDRVGQVETDINGVATLTVRSSASPDLLTTSEVATFTLIAAPDGSVTGPIEFIDPLPFGGTCTGGSIRLGELTSDSYATVAVCDGGSEVRIEVTTTVDDPQELPLLREPLLATPVNYRIVIDGDEAGARTVTLWFTDDGLVRRTHEIDGVILHLNLAPDALIRPED